MSYNDPKILGAGRPRYDAWEPEEDTEDDGTPTPEPPKPTPAPTTAVIKLDVLSRGSTGGQVNTVKALLNQYGWSDGLPLDGDFDWATEQAVKAYQSGYRLDVTGIVDAETWNLLLR